MVTPAGTAKSKAKASIRVAGTSKRASVRGRGRLKVRLRTRSGIRRSARVVVRYESGRSTGRAVVRLGKAVKVKTARR